MKKTKTYFGLLILFFFSVMLIISVYFAPIVLKIDKQQAINYALNKKQTINKGCSMELPAERTIFIRIDDIRAYSYKEIVLKMVNELTSRNISMTLGVIPINIDKDTIFIKYINTLRKNTKIEIAQHGYEHSVEEFKLLNETEALSRIIQGKNLIINNLGIVPITFIPPYNEYNKYTLKAIKQEGFLIMSAKQYEYKNEEEIDIIGYDAKTSNFHKDSSELITIPKVIESCNISLNQKNLCAVVIHPQEFINVSNNGAIDKERYFKFLELLDGLQELNAEFKTFKDLVSCRDYS